MGDITYNIFGIGESNNVYQMTNNNLQPITLQRKLQKIFTENSEYIYAIDLDGNFVYQQKPFNLKILKQDVDKYIEADEDYQKIKQKVDYLETIVDFLDRTIRQIQNRGFLIKDAIEWRKFTSGAI